MNTGNWNVCVTDKMPQVIATAMAELADKMLGVEYEFIAYLGSQVVNGINHAVLAKQVVVTGRDTENIVMLVFNEKPNDVKATLIGIDRIVEGGMPMGGVHIDVETQIPAEAMAEWDAAFDGFVGAKVDPVALLATQAVSGVNYIYFAVVSPMTLESESKVAVVTVNSKAKTVSFADILSSRQAGSLGYAFTW